MGCTMSFRKSSAGEDILVSVCRQRKKLIKSAVDCRYILAGAHCKYNQSLYAVALALRLFVSRHSLSDDSSKFLITYPASSPHPTVDLPHTQSKPNREKLTADDEDDESRVCEHFYKNDDDVDDNVIVTSANENDFSEWDFFSPFDNLAAGHGCDAKMSQGIDAKMNLGGIDAKMSQDAKVSQAMNEGKGLLEALQDVEDCFLKAYECGVEFSKLLEFNHNVGPVDSKEISERFIPSITWHKSTITRSPSCRSLLSSSSRSSWSGININTDLFDETGGMESGSHLSTLGRLYAWEKKLYDEAKDGNEMKKIYDQKCSQLSTTKAGNKQVIEDQINDLYSRILVNVKICDSISKRITKVRDDELLPQLVELLRGLTKTWKVMLESHKSQSQTMFEVKSFQCTPVTNDKSRHLATLQLEAEIQNWRTCFSTYISSMEVYIESLSEWAHRTIAPENEFDAPPLVFTICRNWLNVTRNLPDKAVTYAMKRFAKDLRDLWAQQEIERQQKQKVDRLIAESDKRVAGFERDERSIIINNNKQLNVKNKFEFLAEKKDDLEGFRTMVETEKAKHKSCVEETRRVILVGFQTGFASVFDSLTEFSEVCVTKYNDVAQNATLGSNLVRGC
ncbi:protein ALTERED PHOSPHATE STARVATION RESPONSE 1-like [Rutidosis leptorrhynchoides]|uniref:protein ALTERED PHOSPHATE STARVATION RESPONSE 1-like n=1 Tax=Rutidosis leptorrhynchoides TaxID=125765 RepID=UPI003A998B61